MIPKTSLQMLATACRDRRLRCLLPAYLLFAMMEWGTWVVMLVYAYQRGGTTGAAVVAMLQLLAAALLAPAGAALSDRLTPARALVVGYLAQAGAIATTAACLYLRLPVACILLGAIATAVAVTLTRPVLFTMLPVLSGTGKVLAATNTVTAVIEGGAILAGPLLAGALLEFAGPATALAAFATLQVVAALLVAAAPAIPARSAPRARRSCPDEVRAGWQLLRREPGVMVLVVCVGIAFFIVGVADLLAVVLAFELLDVGESGPGALMAGMGIGGLLGGMASLALAARGQLAAAVGMGGLIAGGGFALAGLSEGLLFALTMWCLSGAGRSLLEVAARTLLQRTLHGATLSSVFGLQEGFTHLMMALGSIAVPLLILGAGARGAFVLVGGLLPLMIALCWQRVSQLEMRGLRA